MKKLLTLCLLALCIGAFSCKKSDSTTPTNNPSNPYYFKFTLDGTSYNFTSALPQYMSAYDDRAGGYQEVAPLAFPMIGLAFDYDSAVTDAQVKALAGKTFYFNGKNPKPSIEFDADATSGTWYSVDTSNTNFNVKVTSVTYVKKDTTIFNPVLTYAIKGTCNAVLEGSGGKLSALSNGDFNFIISCVSK
jgi:hypothetical protein